MAHQTAGSTVLSLADDKWPEMRVAVLRGPQVTLLALCSICILFRAH
jgi:hypothetical protein